MKTKTDIVTNWLPRYTDTPVDKFGKYVLLTNFVAYVHQFARAESAEVRGLKRPMQTATSADGITIVNFGIGSPNAATICDLLSAVQPEAVLFLGKCGGLKPEVHVGDFILPIAAVRAEGTSDSYYPSEIPALPSFQLQKAVSHTIVANSQKYHTGTIFTTNRRVWEHDDAFKAYLQRTRCIGIDMETATLFIASFANHIPHGALLLVSDMPMTPEGVKTDRSDSTVTEQFAALHLKMGTESLRELRSTGESVRYLVF
ncbi:MAG: AMP nucleosidase [Planctomycetes bacterium]|nr:AMP nucleosidase [Planctomycetota bacterium]